MFSKNFNLLNDQIDIYNNLNNNDSVKFSNNKSNSKNINNNNKVKTLKVKDNDKKIIKTKYENLNVINQNIIEIKNGEKDLDYENLKKYFKEIDIVNIEKEKIPFFLEKTNENICQGSFGNCYFISSLISVFNNKFSFDKIFETNNEKYYKVYLFCNGIWNLYYLKKELIKKNNEMISLKSNELWPIFLEKAYAIMNKGFFNMIKGESLISLRELTGAPTIKYKIQDNKNIWNIIKDGIKNNYPICCGTMQLKQNNKNIEKSENLGLVSKHSYSILDIYDKNNLKLIKIKNPWGYFIYNNKNIKKYPTNDNFFNIKDKGTYLIELDNFLKYYNHLDISLFKNNYFNIFTDYIINSNKSIKLFYTEIEEGKHYITIDQIYEKFIDNKNYNISRITILLFKITENDEYEYIDSKYDMNQFIFLDVNLKKGKYVIYVDTPWCSISNKFVLGIYSKYNHYKINSFEEKNLRKDFLKEIFINHSLKNIKDWKTSNNKEYFVYFKLEKGIFYVINKNLKKNQKTKFSFDFKPLNLFYTKNLKSISKINLEFKEFNKIECEYLLIRNLKYDTKLSASFNYKIISN